MSNDHPQTVPRTSDENLSVQLSEDESPGPSDLPSSWSYVSDEPETNREALTARNPHRPGPTSSPTPRRRRRDIFSLHSLTGSNASFSPSHHHRRVRPSLYRVIEALFNSTQESGQSSPSATDVVRHQPITQQTIPEHREISPSTVWGNSSGTQVSLNSLELIGPGSFLFSSPTFEGYAGATDASRPNSLSACNNSSFYRRGSGGASFSSLTRSSSFSNYSNDTQETLDDVVLEPYQKVELTRSLSDVLLGDSDREDVEADGLWLPRSVPPPTLTAPRARHAELSSLVSSFSAQLLRYIFSFLDQRDHKHIRLTCQPWKHAIDHLEARKSSKGQDLPTELLQQIYDHLNPADFNAARHTCRVWMIASLDLNLLSRMLKRGAWWTGLQHSLTHNDAVAEWTGSSKEWLASRILARECILRPTKAHRIPRELDFEACSPSPVVQSVCADFAGLCATEGKRTETLIFTVSVCSKFVLIARGRIIYIYELRGNDIFPLTSIICPRRVLSMSMDSSSGRYAIAALLDSRMGLVCDLRFGPSSANVTEASMSSDSTHDANGGERFSMDNRSPSPPNPDDERPSFTENGTVAAPRRGFEIGESGEHAPAFDAINVHNGDGDFTLLSPSPPHDRHWINRALSIKFRGERTDHSSHNGESLIQHRTSSANQTKNVLHLETGPRNIYRHLCSEEDPPRSVAICPQRRCVAFGCAAGIELHWVDALTGQDMNRWFPLTAPSDILYFLPPRHNVDSARKLRLISSAVHPLDRPEMCKRFFASRPALSTFWGAFGLDNRIGPHASSLSSYDHYRAVPLSDGYHILFTEPSSNALCLGCDAPIGGPNKLLRKVLFLPPRLGAVPRLYAAAHDLRHGARVVVGFADTVMLYSVPPDLLALSRAEHLHAETVVGDEQQQQQPPPPHDWVDWWPEADEPLDQYIRQDHAVWPLQLRGVYVGSVPELVDLAVNFSPQLTIWTFRSDGRAGVFRVAVGRQPHMRMVKSRFGRDGLVAEAFEVDADGDVVMSVVG